MIGEIVPPQNLDAEEAVLGGLMLDLNAIERVVDCLQPEAFYIHAHQQIYKSILALYNQQKPTDLISVTTWLYDRDKLEAVGGQSFLAQLVDRTVSTVNIDLSARPSMGKSAMSAQLAYCMAEMHSTPALIFSLEMDKIQVIDRFLSVKSGIDLKHVRGRQFT